jgi:hypothetical protein
VTVDPFDFFGAVDGLLWVALAIAVGVVVLAVVWIVARFVSTRLERRFLPDVARWSRRRAGMPEDAGPWACPACSSVNAPTVSACYRCGGPRPSDARELVEATTDPTVFHLPPPVNRFDPALYRGPGAPAAGDSGTSGDGVPGGRGQPSAAVREGAPGVAAGPGEPLGAVREDVPVGQAR